MAELIKSIEDIENLLREAVLMILSLDPEKSHSRIRFPWGSNLKANVGSAPAWSRTEDVCIIYALPYDDPYNRQRNRRYRYDQKADQYILIEEFTDVHNFMFCNYGPNAYECARDIRNGLFRNDIKLFLEKQQFHLIPNIPAPLRVPEIHNEEWWNRVDISARFNEFVRIERKIGTIEDVNVIIPGQLPKDDEGGIQTAGGIIIITEKDKYNIERSDS